MRYFLLLCAGLIFCYGCEDKREQEHYKVTHRIKNVVRVFMHEPDVYTVYYQKPGSDKIEKEYINSLGTDKVAIIADVAPDEMMHVEFACEHLVPCENRKGCNKKLCVNMKKAKIHIHSVDDINGAGWNHGRHGRGQTVVIE